MKAVFFDIGETLIDETRPWSVVANWLAIPQMSMFAVLGKLVAEHRDHRELFDIVRGIQGPRPVAITERTA